jgi:hypothetical protein
MKSREIRRLELISDKIEAGDSKSKIMCICFGHPQRKMTLVGALYRRTAMAELELDNRQWEIAEGG